MFSSVQYLLILIKLWHNNRMHSFIEMEPFRLMWLDDSATQSHNSHHPPFKHQVSPMPFPDITEPAHSRFLFQTLAIKWRSAPLVLNIYMPPNSKSQPQRLAHTLQSFEKSIIMPSREFKCINMSMPFKHPLPLLLFLYCLVIFDYVNVYIKLKDKVLSVLAGSFSSVSCAWLPWITTIQANWILLALKWALTCSSVTNWFLWRTNKKDVSLMYFLSLWGFAREATCALMQSTNDNDEIFLLVVALMSIH